MSLELYAEGNINQADKVLNETQDRGFRPSLLTYEAKVAALRREGRVDEAVNVVDVEMAEANCVLSVRFYNILLKGLCDAGNSVTAAMYLKEMAEQTGCVANKETYCILVDGLCEDGRFVEASRVLEKMLIKSYWPSRETINMLILGLCSVGRLYEAGMWLEEMVTMGELPETKLWNSLVSCACSDRADTHAYSEALERLNFC